MRKFHVKKGDEVVVRTGAERGKRGKIIHLDTKKERVYIEGVRMSKRHMRKSQQYPQGAIVEREGSIHISNVMAAEKYDARTGKQPEAEEAAE